MEFIIEKTPIKLSSLSKSDIGRTVLFNQQGHESYGILVGFNEKYILVHFANNTDSLTMRPELLYFVSYKKNKN